MIGSIGDAGRLSRLISESAATRRQVDTLNLQVSTGRASETYGGLGAAARTPLSLRPQLASGERWQSNIDAAQGRLGVTQSALEGVSAVAKEFFARTSSLNGLDPAAVDSVAASARAALKQVAGLLNSRSGDIYVFAGQDTANPPVPSSDNILASPFFTSTQAAVAGLAANGAAATATATLGIAAGASPFSGTSGGVPTVEIGDGEHVGIGLLADRNTLAASGGASSTGSYMRDIMRGLATLGSLSSGQVGTVGFDALVGDTRTSLRDAVSAMSVEQGALGDAQRTFSDRHASIGDQAFALSSQISSIEDVDPYEAATQLMQRRTQLEASYKILAGMKELSLTNYL